LAVYPSPSASVAPSLELTRWRRAGSRGWPASSLRRRAARSGVPPRPLGCHHVILSAISLDPGRAMQGVHLVAQWGLGPHRLEAGEQRARPTGPSMGAVADRPVQFLFHACAPCYAGGAAKHPCACAYPGPLTRSPSQTRTPPTALCPAGMGRVWVDVWQHKPGSLSPTGTRGGAACSTSFFWP